VKGTVENVTSLQGNLPHSREGGAKEEKIWALMEWLLKWRSKSDVELGGTEEIKRKILVFAEKVGKLFGKNGGVK